MILFEALHFGGNFGPTSWEPISNARCFLAIWLHTQCTYQIETNDKLLSIIEFSSTSHSWGCKDQCCKRPLWDKFMDQHIDPTTKAFIILCGCLLIICSLHCCRKVEIWTFLLPLALRLYICCKDTQDLSGNCSFHLQCWPTKWRNAWLSQTNKLRFQYWYEAPYYKYSWL